MKKGFAFEVTSDMIHEMHLTGSSLLVFAYLDAFSKDGGYYVHGIENIGKMLVCFSHAGIRVHYEQHFFHIHRPFQ